MAKLPHTVRLTERTIALADPLVAAWREEGLSDDEIVEKLRTVIRTGSSDPTVGDLLKAAAARPANRPQGSDLGLFTDRGTPTGTTPWNPTASTESQATIKAVRERRAEAVEKAAPKPRANFSPQTLDALAAERIHQ